MVSKYLGAKPVLKILIITILLVITVFLVFRFTSKSREGFSAYDNWNALAIPNKDYYWNKFNRGLMFTDGLADTVNQMDRATQIVDPQFNAIKKPNLQKQFLNDPLPGMLVQNQLCANASEPSQLPPHDVNTVSGCGWWYVDDDRAQSIGIYRESYSG